MLLQVLSHLGSLDQLLLDRVQELRQVRDHVLVGDADVPVQEIEKLSLHQVDILQGEEAVCICGPVNVLGRRVVVELRGENQAAQEDSVSGARQALRVFWELQLQFAQVYKGGHQGARVHIGVAGQAADERHERRQGLLANYLRVLVFVAGDDLQGGHHQLVDHVVGDGPLDEKTEGFQVGR